MRLLTPSGTRIGVSDEDGERLLKRKGYKRLDGAATAAPSGEPEKAAENAPKRRTRSPKVTTPDNK